MQNSRFKKQPTLVRNPETKAPKLTVAAAFVNPRYKAQINNSKEQGKSRP